MVSKETAQRMSHQELANQLKDAAMAMNDYRTAYRNTRGQEAEDALRNAVRRSINNFGTLVSEQKRRNVELMSRLYGHDDD